MRYGRSLPSDNYAILDKSKYFAGRWRMAHVEALREFNRFYTRRIDVLRKDYLGSPFALPEARLVFEIGRVPGVSATTLGRDLGIDLGYLSRVLQGLKRRGYVQAKRTPEDARRAALTLTEKGRKAC